MALESLAVSKQIQRPAIVKLPFVLGVSDPPFLFQIVGLHFNKQPFPLRRRLGVLRSRLVHISRRKTSPLKPYHVGV
jgi:hypothetical protein